MDLRPSSILQNDIDLQPPRRWRMRIPFRPHWSLTALGAFVLVIIHHILFQFNFHAVIPRKCYRSGQPGPDQIRQWKEQYGLRSIVNLRGVPGEHDRSDWFQAETAVGQQLGLRLFHINLWATRAPEVAEMHRLIQILDEAPPPILLHCHTGGDRTGLASALYLLLKTPADIDDARQQLSLFYGHPSWGGREKQDQVLEAYEFWLRGQGLSHRPELLKKWALHIYNDKAI